MRVLNLLGDGRVNALVGVALAVAGLLARQRRLVRTGLVVLAAVVVAGLLVNGLKLAFAVPRPIPITYRRGPVAESYSFPSGHTTTAFTVASVLGVAAPGWAPLFHGLAMLGATARLYYRMHYASDVVAGAVVGCLTGWLVGRRWLLRADRDRPRPWWPVVLPVLLAIPVLVFFAAYERALALHRAPPVRETPVVSLVFGTPEARRWLGEGWSPDERGPVWLQGRDATLRLPAIPAGAAHLRLRVQPWTARRELSCRHLEVLVNGHPVGRLLLERGWHTYEIAVAELAEGPNELRFQLGDVRAPDTGDARASSVALASLDLVRDEQRRP